MRYNALLCLAALSLAGCGDNVPAIETTTFAASLGVNLAAMTKTPNGLYYQDQIVGTGALAENGKDVSVHYAGSLPDGQLFDVNIAPAAPLIFRIGVHGVILGFEEGVTGMRVGGRRLILIPPSLGYGAQATGNIPKNSILVFRIDLVGVI